MLKSAAAGPALAAIVLACAGGAAAQCLESAPAWRGRAFPARTAAFGALFDAIPLAAGIDAVTGLSHGPAAGFESLAAAVRFNNSGFIDARDGGAYGSTNLVPYIAGAAYRFRLWIDPGAGRYSVHVTPPGGTETPLALNFAFRAGTANASLDAWAIYSASGSHRVCGFRLAAAAPADVAPPSAAITAPAAGAVVSGSVTVAASASDDVGVAGVRFLADGLPLGEEATSPPFTLAWNTAASPNGAHTLTVVVRDSAGNKGTTTIAVTVDNPRR